MEESLKYVNRIREFNRFYTVLLGIVDRKYLDDYSLAESRILYELYSSPGCSAVSISEKLRIDKGYMSRMVKKFIDGGLLDRRPSESDGRYYQLYLTDLGQSEAKGLIAKSNAQIEALIQGYDSDVCDEIYQAMDVITKYLGKGGE